MLFFSSTGMVYRLKVWRLPLGSPQSRGKALVNLLPLSPGETITACLLLPEDEAEWKGRQLLFTTSAGTVRRNSLTDFSNIRQSGLIAMKLEPDQRLVAVRDVVWSDEDEGDQSRPRPRVLLVTAAGKAIKFPLDDVRLFKGRDSSGVRGIRLGEDDSVIDMSVLAPDADQETRILSVADDGVGRLTEASEFRETARGGQGIANLDLRRSGGKEARVVATFPVALGDELMLVTDGGTMIRCPVEGIRIAGRATRGVRILDVAEGERVVSVTRLAEEGEASASGGGDEA